MRKCNLYYALCSQTVLNIPNECLQSKKFMLLVTLRLFQSVSIDSSVYQYTVFCVEVGGADVVTIVTLPSESGECWSRCGSMPVDAIITYPWAGYGCMVE